jgi:hypothetical protein
MDWPKIVIAMHSDIAKAIDLIEQRIQALQNIRAQLVQEFTGAEEAKSNLPKDTPAVVLPPRMTRHNHPRNGGTRKDQVAHFIRQNGPSLRTQIIEGTQIPVGTIAYCLNDKTRFQQRKDGKWDLMKTGE